MRVDIGGVRLFFDVVGSGLRPDPDEMRSRPTLLVLHGGPGFDHSTFRPWFDRFADTHQVVYLDHRGQGRSDGRRDEDGWNLDTWADDIVRFCDALDIEHPAVFGNSFGGMVAMHYGGRHPDHPSRLVLSSTGARMHLEPAYAMFERLGGPDARRIAEAFWDGEPAGQIAVDYFEVCLPLYNQRSDNLTSAPRHTWANPRVIAHWGIGEGRTFDLRESLSRIRCPVLALAGDLDPICPTPAFDEIVATLEGARVDTTAIRFPDCGHGSYRDAPDQTEDALRAFLD